MSRRRQRTEFYGRFVGALRMINRRRWVSCGEKLLEVYPGELDLVDNAALHDEVLCQIEDLVSQALHDKAASLRAQADAVERAARDFDAQSELRRFDVRQAAKRRSDDETEALVQRLYDWTFRHNDTQEAA